MPGNKIHIVSFDVPWPANYGGVIDVFYKIKALHEAGAEIYLHCFAYGRPQSSELNKFCKEVWYYPRHTGVGGISFTLPYIVYSRRNEHLLKRLIDIDAPILFEGVHTTYYLNHPGLKSRKKAIRTHNIEWEYYTELALKETNFKKRLYFKQESSLLKKYEHTLQNADALLALSVSDGAYFSNLYPETATAFVAPFHPYNEIESLTGVGKYCLYHGNLSHPENREAVLYLMKEVFPFTDMPLIVAGKEPAEDVFAACNTLKTCRLISNPTDMEMHRLIQDAHINILPTFQASGMKLKLLYALFCGRHLIVNKQMLHGTGLYGCCAIAERPRDFITLLEEYQNRPFTNEDITIRKEALKADYDNALNAQRILTYLLG